MIIHSYPECLISQRSSFSTALYIMAAKMAINTRAESTSEKSNTWKPYIIK